MTSTPDKSAACATCGRSLSEHNRHVRFRLADPVLDLPDRERTAGVLMSHNDANKSVMMQVPDVGPFCRSLLPIRLDGGYTLHSDCGSPSTRTSCSVPSRSGGHRSTTRWSSTGFSRTAFPCGEALHHPYVPSSAIPSTRRASSVRPTLSWHTCSYMSGPMRRSSVTSVLTWGPR